MVHALVTDFTEEIIDEERAEVTAGSLCENWQTIVKNVWENLVDV